MNNNQKTLSIAVAFGLMGLPTYAQAAGFQLAEYSATGLGRAYAGEAAMADNAGSQWRNPAMLTYLPGTQFSAGAIYVNPNIDVNGTVTHPNLGQTTATAKDFAHDAIVPNAYFSHQLNERTFLGLAIGTNYGMETELPNFAASHFGDQAKIITAEANVNLGYQLTDTISVGAGVRYVIGEGHFGASVPEKNIVGMDGTNPIKAPQGTILKYMEGDDTSWGWQAGTAWQINPEHRVAFTYKSQVVMDFDGHAEGLPYGKHKPGQLAVTLPATAELASFHQLTEQWALHSSINWTDWSSFDQLVANFHDGTPNDLIKLENWKDNYRFALGTSYAWDQDLTLRAGIAYDLSAVSTKYRTATIPETDRTWLSIGAGYRATKQLTLDAGFTYIFAKKASLYEPRDGSDNQAAAIGGAFAGEVTGHVWLVGVQASYTF